MAPQMDDETLKVVERVEKLLRLAAKNTNEAEAAAATQKAQELLVAYNIDAAILERRSGGTARREQAEQKGGMYKYQQDLWRAIASLNFCIYWNQKRGHVIKRRGIERIRYSSEHVVVGRTVNVASTKAMAEYLEQTLDRMTRERLGDDQSQFFSGWAVSYRQGIADRVIGKIHRRRRELLDEEQKREAAAREAAIRAGRDGVSTATALTISHYVNEEYDANIDFVYGAGTSARWAAERAERAAKAKAEEEAYARWAAANPEEAARKEAERRAAARKGPGSRGGRTERGPSDSGAYYSGYDDGGRVSIDPQAEHRTGGLLR